MYEVTIILRVRDDPPETVERMRQEMEELTVESVLASKAPWEI